MSIVAIKRDIRHALQVPLKTVCAALSPAVPIQWGSTAIDRNGVARWVSVEINWGDVQVLEIGPNPRFQGKGGLTLVVRTPLKLGEDTNDTLVKDIIPVAYPYGIPLTFGSATVHVDKMTPGAYGIDGAFITSLTTVDWQTFKRP
jgi:hypothetical protein